MELCDSSRAEEPLAQSVPGRGSGLGSTRILPLSFLGRSSPAALGPHPALKTLDGSKRAEILGYQTYLSPENSVMSQPSAYLGSHRLQCRAGSGPGALHPLTPAESWFTEFYSSFTQPWLGLPLTGSSFSAATVGKIKSEKSNLKNLYSLWLNYRNLIRSLLGIVGSSLQEKGVHGVCSALLWEMTTTKWNLDKFQFTVLKMDCWTKRKS